MASPQDVLCAFMPARYDAYERRKAGCGLAGSGSGWGGLGLGFETLVWGILGFGFFFSFFWFSWFVGLILRENEAKPLIFERSPGLSA